MKPSDFIITSEQRNDATQNLLQTEVTDAVNSGIVDRADKSEKSLKGSLYSVGKKTSTGGAASAALSAVTKGRKGKPGSASATALAGGAVHKTLEGTELEGADGVYHNGKAVYAAGKAIRRRVSGKAAPTDMKKPSKEPEPSRFAAG